MSGDFLVELREPVKLEGDPRHEFPHYVQIFSLCRAELFFLRDETSRSERD
jgi:hypothetical protein